MVVINAQKSGDASDSTVWPSGTYPTADDTVHANGFTIQLDGREKHLIIGGDQAEKQFIINADLSYLVNGDTLRITNSTANDGIYTVNSASTLDGITTVTVTQDIPSATFDGDIQDTNLTWGTVTTTDDGVGGSAGGGFNLHPGTYLKANVLAGTTTCVTRDTAGADSYVVGNVTGGTVNYMYGVRNNSNGSIYVTGDALQGVAPAIHGSTGTFILNGTTDQTYNSVNADSIGNLQVQKPSGKLTFESDIRCTNFTANAGSHITGNQLMTVDQNFTLQGTREDRSTWDGMDLNVSGTTLARWSVVQNSDASAGEPINAEVSMDGGNNVNWWFWHGIDPDEIELIAANIWDRLTSTITTTDSIGELVQQLARSATPENKLAIDTDGKLTIPPEIITEAVLTTAPGITGTITDESPTTSTFITDLTSEEDDHFNKQFLLLTNGPLKGQSRKIATIGGYIGAEKRVVLEHPFTSIPANGTAFVIIGRSE
jgi:hypothetical protein